MVQLAGSTSCKCNQKQRTLNVGSQSGIKQLCEEAIQRVSSAIMDHEDNKPADLSVPLLREVKRELEMMLSKLNPNEFQPHFGRFILEWPDEHGLIAYLLDVEYQYERMASE